MNSDKVISNIKSELLDIMQEIERSDINDNN